MSFTMKNRGDIVIAVCEEVYTYLTATTKLLYDSKSVNTRLELSMIKKALNRYLHTLIPYVEDKAEFLRECDETVLKVCTDSSGYRFTSDLFASLDLFPPAPDIRDKYESLRNRSKEQFTQSYGRILVRSMVGAI